MNSPDKPCPKCGTILKIKGNSKWCQNGCDIFTAVPRGSGFTVKANDSMGQIFAHSDGLRKTPTQGGFEN